MPSNYRYGRQDAWFPLYLDIIDAYLKLARAEPSEADISNLKALKYAEASKSRVMMEQILKEDISSELAYPRNNLKEKNKLLRKLSALDTEHTFKYLNYLIFPQPQEDSPAMRNSTTLRTSCSKFGKRWRKKDRRQKNMLENAGFML